MTELARRDLRLQWSPASWRGVMGVRQHWPVPDYAEPARWRIINAFGADAVTDGVVFRNAQFVVLRAAP